MDHLRRSMKYTHARSRSPGPCFLPRWLGLHLALFSGAAGHMVSFCQFPDAASGRVDVHRRILGTPMGTARYAAYAHPRCGAGVPEYARRAHASSCSLRSCLHCRWYHTSPRTASSPGAPMAPSRCASSWPRSGQLAALFPAGGHLLNMCSDRYRFSVGLAAAIVAGKVSLLPPTRHPEVVRQIKVFAPDVFCLTDSDLCTVDLPQLRYPVMGVSQADAFAVPQIDGTQRIAVVFTSGSTGTPQPHPKPGAHWSAACRPKHCAWGYCTTRPAP